ncbi:MAG: exo-alpha-sialidase [Deltaproteobacteria bacterium]|nr:exo-alpha-sialidase [Deltaproteobacteria bacterium]
MGRAWVCVGVLAVVCSGCGDGDDDDDDSPDAAPADAAPAPADAAPTDGAGPDVRPDAALFVPGPALLLSDGSPSKDEDPFILRTRDGRLHVAWFSERTGNGDIYLRSTSDGANFDAPVQLTSGPAVDFFPALTQSASARIHAVWFRRDTSGARGRIVYSHSDAISTWPISAEVDVTTPTGSASDWTPQIAETASGALVVVFVRDGCWPQPQPCFGLWATRSTTGGATWTPAAQILPTAGQQDHLPSLLASPAGLTLVWNRYDASATLPWLTATTDVALATSTDGVTWTAGTDLTSNDGAAITDVFPALYADHAGALHALWLEASSTAMAVVEQRLGATTPSPISDLPAAGYSHHLVATPTPGRFLAAWVAGSGSALDIQVRVIAR